MNPRNLDGVERPVPPVRSYSAPYWEATRERRLLLQYDVEVGRHQFYPRPTSIFTGRRSHLEWREVSGRGVVASFTIVERAPPAFRGFEPYPLILVTLPEQVQIMSNLVDCRIEALTTGMAVRPAWAPLADGRHILLFRPDR